MESSDLRENAHPWAVQSLAERLRSETVSGAQRTQQNVRSQETRARHWGTSVFTVQRGKSLMRVWYPRHPSRGREDLDRVWENKIFGHTGHYSCLCRSWEWTEVDSWQLDRLSSRGLLFLLLPGREEMGWGEVWFGAPEAKAVLLCLLCLPTEVYSVKQKYYSHSAQLCELQAEDSLLPLKWTLLSFPYECKVWHHTSRGQPDKPGKARALLIW